MDIQAIVVPYDSAQRNARMGAGPLRLLEGAVEPLLRDRKTILHVACVEALPGFQAEIATAFDLNRQLAEHVSGAVRARRFPLVLSGNCNAAIGTAAGVGMNALGIIWFDAHGDFNTPETSTSGFFDGMGLATLAGLCWKNLAASVTGFAPVAGENILHLGAREVSESELRNAKKCGAQLCPAADLHAADDATDFTDRLQRLRQRVGRVYVHLDLDVLDPAEARANEFAPPGGLTADVLVDVLRAVRNTFAIEAAGVASYDPAQDDGGRAIGIARRLLEVLLPEE